MALPVVTVASGGRPVVVSTNGFGMPVDEATNGRGIPVTQVTNFGMPVIYVTGGNPIISPVLTLTSPTTDTTPDFTLAGDLAAADVTRFQYATNSSFTGATDITHTITAPEDAANSFSFSTGALALGTWYFRARVERPVIGNSGWSNTVSETIATATYVGPGDIAAGALCWYGLRAYSAATIGSNCVRIKRASDSTQQTFVTLASGVVDVASITTFLASTTGKVAIWYDQSGNGMNTDVTATGAVDDCTFTLGAFGSFSGVSPNGDGQLESLSNSGTTYPQPYTIAAVAKRTSGGQSSVIVYDNGAKQILFGSGASTVGFYAGSAVPTVAATDGAVHDIICEVNDATSIIRVDGVDNTGIIAGTTTGMVSGGPFGFPSITSGGLTGVVFEGGFWPGTVNRAALSANMRAYYGL